MRTLPIYVFLVFVLGALATWALASSALGMTGNPAGHQAFWILIGLWAAFPAFLSALAKKAALLILALLLAAMANWAYRASFATDDGGMAMGIIIMVAVVTGMLGSVAIAGRGLFLGKQAT